MKVAPIKLAVGFGVTALAGLTAFAAAKDLPPNSKVIHKAMPVVVAPKPGHTLVQTPGKALTAAQIVERCGRAYGELQSYQITATVTTRGVTVASGEISTYHTSAEIAFVRPGKIHAEGIDMSGNAFAYVSDGTVTLERNLGTGWKKAAGAEMSIAAVTGTAQGAATTIPALLLGTHWGNPFTPQTAPEVREDSVEGNPCYVVTSSLAGGKFTIKHTFWIDEKTFLLHRCISDSDNKANTLVVGGKSIALPALKTHQEEDFTNEHRNGPILDSTFALPAMFPAAE